MSKLVAFVRSLLGPSSSARTPRSYGRTIDPNYSIFQEGDRVIYADHRKIPFLSNKLERDGKTDTPLGSLSHNDIIGKKVRAMIKNHKGALYRLTIPSLSEYVTLSNRVVTPIYPADANLIVSLLDIHVSRPSPKQNSAPPMEILEAGTGNGALTLHLARAIHAANTTPPPFPLQSQVRGQAPTENNPESLEADQKNIPAEEKQVQEEWDSWRAQRGAVIHTVDNRHNFTKHAERFVRGFRRGMYTGEVDFYVSPVEDWIDEQTRRRTTGGLIKRVYPFLTYVLLDMPSAQNLIPKVAPIMRADGVLAIFTPNVTQIAECVDIIRRQRLPFLQEKTVELGTGISSGRLWDIKVVQTRAHVSRIVGKRRAVENQDQTDPEQSVSEFEREPSADAVKSEGDIVQVCKPKVGERIVGGGFVAIFRKMEQ